METPEDNDPTWDLLKQRSSVEPGPMFSRNVVREARNTPQATPFSGFFSFERLRKRMIPALAIPAIAVVAVAVLLPSLRDSSAPIVVETPQVAAQPLSLDYVEDVDYLGELMAVVDPTDFDDAMIADLLF